MFRNHSLAVLAAAVLVGASGSELFAQTKTLPATQPRPKPKAVAEDDAEPIAAPATTTRKSSTPSTRGATPVTKAPSTQPKAGTSATGRTGVRQAVAEEDAVPTRQTRKADKIEQPEQKSRPTAQPYRIEKVAAEEREPLDPELEQILKDWELKSSEIETLTCTFKKFRYNHKFQVDYRAEGQVVYQSPDHGVYVLKAAELAGLKGRSIDINNKPLAKPYELKADNAEQWVCDGKQITQIDQAAKTYKQIPIPEDMQGQRIVEGPLPFLFGMKAEAAKARYWIKLVKHDEEKHEILLTVYPKLKMDAANYQRATVMIDDQQFTPKAVKLVDPTGNEEVVHTFYNMKINSKLGSAFRDPFKPSLGGLKMVSVETAPRDDKAPRPSELGRPAPKGTTAPTRTTQAPAPAKTTQGKPRGNG